MLVFRRSLALKNNLHRIQRDASSSEACYSITDSTQHSDPNSARRPEAKTAWAREYQLNPNSLSVMRSISLVGERWNVGVKALRVGKEVSCVRHCSNGNL